MVIRFSASAESERSWCVGFSQESISGIEALRLTGLPVVTKTFASQGEYVCKIGDVGTDSADCPAKDGSYWGYWRMTAQGWRHSGIGASSARVRCGSMEGWAWLQGGTGPAPSSGQFSSVCRSAACEAVPSAVSAPPAGEESRSQQPAGAPAADAAPPRDPLPDAQGNRSRGAGQPGGPSQAVSTRPPPAQGAEPERRPEPAQDPDNRPVTGRPVQTSTAPIAGQAPPGAEQTSAIDSAVPAARRKTSPALFATLAGIIGLLASARAYLFWRKRRKARPAAT